MVIGLAFAILAQIPNSAPWQVAPHLAQMLIVRRIAPVYPPLAGPARIQGTVVLDVILDKGGKRKQDEACQRPSPARPGRRRPREAMEISSFRGKRRTDRKFKPPDRLMSASRMRLLEQALPGMLPRGMPSWRYGRHFEGRRSGDCLRRFRGQFHSQASPSIARRHAGPSEFQTARAAPLDAPSRNGLDGNGDQPRRQCL